MAAALAAGCTAVVKPAEDTPLTALYFAQVTCFPFTNWNAATFKTVLLSHLEAQE